MKGGRFEGEAGRIVSSLNSSGRFVVQPLKKNAKATTGAKAGAKAAGDEVEGDEAEAPATFAIKPSNLYLPQPDFELGSTAVRGVDSQGGSTSDHIRSPTEEQVTEADLVAGRLTGPELERKLRELGVAVPPNASHEALAQLLKAHWRPTGAMNTAKAEKKKLKVIDR